MAEAWTVEFYEDNGGSAPVEEFLETLDLRHKAKALAVIRLLEEMGPALPFPYSSQVRGRLRELRTQSGKDRIRILYFGDPRRCFVLLHGLIKRAPKLDEQDIRTAEERMRRHAQKLKE